jgi:transcriptional regulator with XRE-family HTH domain
MGTQPRNRPKRLAEKLLQIRKTLGLSQSEIAKAVGITTGAARVSEFERDLREPCMVTVLRYARLARVKMETLVDDNLELIIP